MSKPKKKDPTNVPLDKLQVGGIITVLDKDGNVKSRMKIVSVETREEKKDGTQHDSS